MEMKKIVCIVLFVAAVFMAAPVMAEECGGLKMPDTINGTDRFISLETFKAIGGDDKADILWTGDNNAWGISKVEPYTHEGTPGYLVKGVGEPGMRWNLVQGNNPNFFLKLEKIKGYQLCDEIHIPSETKNGHKYPDSLGPAFW